MANDTDYYDKNCDNDDNYNNHHDNENDNDNNVFDGDGLLARHEKLSLAHISCPKIKQSIHKRRVHKEEIKVCEMLLQQWQAKHGMEVSLSCHGRESSQSLTNNEELDNRRRIVLCYAAALEGLGRRREGEDVLRLCLGVAEECYTELQSSSPSSSPSPSPSPSYDDNHDDNDDDELHFPSEKYLDVSVALALAKLYFKDNRKNRALAWCNAILNKLRNDHANDNNKVQSQSQCCMYSKGDISDAYHLAGWIKIHADDHTGAYELWTEGHEAVPDCDTLHRQYRKRACWDNINDHGDDDDEVTNALLLGGGSHGDGIFNRNEDLEAFVVPVENRQQTPALALFREETQKNALVFRTRHPVLTADECKHVLKEVESFHNDYRDGKWGTVRHSSVKTTDVAVEDIPGLRPWLRDLLRTRLYPLVAAAYPQLADGSTTGHLGSRMRVHDAFIVRYDAECDGSFSLPEHSDTSAVSFTVALNSQNDSDDSSGVTAAAFEGGGTWFEALGDAHKSGRVVDADVGHAVAFAGPLRHAGFPVTRGCRVILVLFLYIDGFSYGKYIQDHIAKHGICSSGSIISSTSSSICTEEVDEKKENTINNEVDSNHEQKVRPSGDMPGGFVVYNQTVELVGMLNRRVESVLD